jgi:exodeoxyribonuclease VII small subunit
MSKTAKTYQQLKVELEEVLAWFEQEDVDVDKALEKHDQAEKLIAELQKYLDETEQKIKKIKS